MAYDFSCLPKVEDFDFIRDWNQFRTRSTPAEWLLDARNHKGKSYAVRFGDGSLLPITSNMDVRSVEIIMDFLSLAYLYSHPEKLLLQRNFVPKIIPIETPMTLPIETYDGFKLAASRFLKLAKEVYDQGASYTAADFGHRLEPHPQAELSL